MSEPRQEVFDHALIDVEREEDGGAGPGAAVLDARKIRISSKQWTLRQAVDDLKDGALLLTPDLERASVWDAPRRSRLVESVLLGIPLPAFYFHADRDGGLHVVDGVQRLAAINDFVNNAFALEGLEYLAELAGKRWNDLEPSFRRRFHGTQLIVNVLEPETPSTVKFNILKRLSTAGEPLSAQELRHALGKERSRTLLARMAGSPAFQHATGGVLKQDVRMAARELALRYLALRLDPELAVFSAAPSLDAFLVATAKRLDDPDDLGDPLLAALEQQFERAMDNAFTLFGEHAFRHWPRDATARSPLSRALFESWAAVLADVEPESLRARKDAIVMAARAAFTDDAVYRDALASPRADVARARLCLAVARRCVTGGQP